ncbi:MAG: PKD repeat protein [Bacteroidia bacterium]|jgi:PKD repeat protein
MADVIVEATLLQKESFWNDEHDYIHTTNLLRVSSVFKGEIVTQDIELITEGGLVALDALVVEPSLQLQVGEVGIFLLRKSNLQFKTKPGIFFQPVASVQSFLKYDMINRTAHGYFEKFENIKGYLFPLIETYTQQKQQKIGTDPLGIGSMRKLAAPVITSIDKDTLTAGTRELLTITGSNFGFIKGKGYLEFVDPNYGDGRFYELHYGTSFKSWSNSKIEVYVPARAGTGKIRVTNNSAETTQSSSSIVVRYAYSNYGYGGTSSVDSGLFLPRHINLNGNGGYRWTLSDNFSGNEAAVNAFYRAAQKWRCGTLMNWDISNSTTTIKKVASDAINIVVFTKFTDSRLGVCSSWYRGCLQGSNAFWYVAELDIIFDSTRNWYYGTNKPGSSQFDFETVATHELGHGHQLSHVIDTKKIMHYSLTNGSRNTTLHQDDLDGGVFVSNESKSGKYCGKNLYASINVNDCNITKPKAKLEVNIPSPCPGTSVRFTDKTEGKVTAYAWDFGQDASTASATGSGPYVVDYSTAGDKTVRLIATNDFGSDTAYLIVKVQAGTPESPIAIVIDTTCIGEGNQTYEVNAVTGATSYIWALPSGGSIFGSNKDRTVIITWSAAGNHDLTVAAKNACGTSTVTTQTATILNDANADFAVIDDGMDFEFTNNSADYEGQQWSFGDGNNSSEGSPKHTYATRNTYTVRLIVSNTCSVDTIEKEVVAKFNLDVKDVDNNRIRISPNPSYGIIEIAGVTDYTFTLTNTLGQIVLERTNSASKTQIDARNLPKGVYTYKIQTPSGVASSGKLMLQ